MIHSEKSEELLQRALAVYSIPTAFPVQLDEGSAGFYPGEHARTEWEFDERNEIYAVKVHSTGQISEGVIFHELAHLKLRFMGVPVFMVPAELPSWAQYFFVVHDEYYARLLFDKVAPNISRRQVQEASTSMQPLDDFCRHLEHIPPEGSRERYEGLVSIVGGEISRLVCQKCPNLRGSLAALEERSKFVKRSEFSRYADGARSALLSMPALPNPSKSFSDDHTRNITNAVNRIVRVMFGQGVPRFEPATYTVRHPP